MADPVLRIPVDDEAFKRYMEAFERYQDQLKAQPDAWADTNAEVMQGVAANLALADSIGEAVSAAIRLGDTQERNARRRKKEKEDDDKEEQRASSWRRKALDHVQELSRTSDKVARGLTNVLGGGANNGGLFGMVIRGGQELGGTLGGLVSLAGHALNAGYETNSSVSDKGLFARGIGASISEQEGFQIKLGRYTNTDRLIDSVMQARGDASQWADAHVLGSRKFFDKNATNAEVSADILRHQMDVYKRFTTGNVTNWQQVAAHGGLAYGTTQEDLNRLGRTPAGDVNKAIDDAVKFKSPLGDKQTDAATKSVVAMDTFTQHLTDTTQKAFIGMLDPSLNRAANGLDKLAQLAEKIASYFPSSWFSGAAPAAAVTGAKGMWDSLMTSGPIASIFNWGHQLLGTPTPFPAGGPATGSTGDLQKAEALAKKMGWQESSGKRDTAEQARLYAKYQAYLHGGPWAAVAARPGSSQHERGTAMDIRYGKGVTLDKIKSELAKIGIHTTEALNEGDHFHVAWGAKGGGRSGGGATSVNSTVNVKVIAPPGHQTAVTTNTAAKG